MASSSCKRRANCTLRRFVIQELKCVSLCRLLCYLDCSMSGTSYLLGIWDVSSARGRTSDCRVLFLDSRR